MRGLKRRSSSAIEGPYRVPSKQRDVDEDDDIPYRNRLRRNDRATTIIVHGDSDSDTISVDSEDSSRRSMRGRRDVSRKRSIAKRPSLSNKESTMTSSGLVTAFLGLRSRTIIREQTIYEDDDPSPQRRPRKMLSAKRRLVKKTSSIGEYGPSAAVSELRRKYSEARAATVI